MGIWDKTGIKFKKSGKEIKAVIVLRLADLEKRLAIRDADLELVMADKARLRSYLVRDVRNDYPHAAQLKQDSPTEDHQRITELCRRIQLIEKEIKRLTITRDNLRDDQELELDFEELTSLGFGSPDDMSFA